MLLTLGNIGVELEMRRFELQLAGAIQMQLKRVNEEFSKPALAAAEAGFLLD